MYLAEACPQLILSDTGSVNYHSWPCCDFIVWTPHSTSVERIEHDINLWQQNMLPKLKVIYLLPELADPVFHSGKLIRHLGEKHLY